jgi:hypothetical protein
LARSSRAHQIFCILVLSRKKNHVWTLENFNVIFGSFARRRSLWRRGNTTMAPRYVLRWHKWTSWRRRGTELGAIDLSAELSSVQNSYLAQLVKYNVLTLWLWVRAPRWAFLILFLYLSLICLFCCPNFSFMSLICPSRFISHPDFFVFVTDLFIRPIFFIRRAQRLCATVVASRQLSPLFAQLTTIKIK